MNSNVRRNVELVVGVEGSDTTVVMMSSLGVSVSVVR